MAKTYKRKYNVTKTLKKLEKKINKMKPEKKTYTTQFNNQELYNNQNSGSNLNNRVLLNPHQGAGGSERIGNTIKAVSYYGIFYVKRNTDATNNSNSNSCRIIHYMANDDSDTLMTAAQVPMKFDTIPREEGYMILEDKLITLNNFGKDLAKVIIKGKFKYPINIEYETSNPTNATGWRPRLLMMSAQNANQNTTPIANGEMRYYYTDV